MLAGGMVVGRETAEELGARVWVSAHDGEKESRGVFGGVRRRRRFAREEVLEGVRDGEEGSGSKARTGGTEVLALGAGEEVVLTSEGLWTPGSGTDEIGKMPSLEEVLS